MAANDVQNEGPEIAQKNAQQAELSAINAQDH